MESNGDHWLREQVLFVQKTVDEYVAFTQFDKCDWDG